MAVTLILAIINDIRIYPEEMRGILYYVKDYVFSPFGVLLLLCVIWDYGYFLMWLSRKRKKTINGIAIWYHVVFALSLLPYLFIIETAIHSYFAGINTGWWASNIEYGWNAVKYVIFWYGLFLTAFPVLPICLVIQIVYVIQCISARKAR